VPGIVLYDIGAGEDADAVFHAEAGIKRERVRGQDDGDVTTTFTYGFVGMGSGTNATSGRMTFNPTNCSMYTGIRFRMKAGNATYQYDVKIVAPKAITNTGDNDWKYTFTGARQSRQ